MGFFANGFQGLMCGPIWRSLQRYGENFWWIISKMDIVSSCQYKTIAVNCWHIAFQWISLEYSFLTRRCFWCLVWNIFLVLNMIIEFLNKDSSYGTKMLVLNVFLLQSIMTTHCCLRCSLCRQCNHKILALETFPQKIGMYEFMNQTHKPCREYHMTYS